MTDRLQKSISQYREIVEHAQKLEGLLRNNEPELIVEYTTRLNQLQAEAGLNDQVLLEDVGHDSTRWQSHPLFLERTQLLEQIMQMNDLLLPRIHGMMSVTASEIAQLKDGRVAVSGYHPAKPKTKGSLGVG